MDTSAIDSATAKIEAAAKKLDDAFARVEKANDTADALRYVGSVGGRVSGTGPVLDTLPKIKISKPTSLKFISRDGLELYDINVTTINSIYSDKPFTTRLPYSVELCLAHAPRCLTAPLLDPLGKLVLTAEKVVFTIPMSNARLELNGHKLTIQPIHPDISLYTAEWL